MTQISKEELPILIDVSNFYRFYYTGYTLHICAIEVMMKCLQNPQSMRYN